MIEVTNYRAVTSSNLTHVGYDESSRTLGVKFKNGTEYHYHDVPRGIYVGLLVTLSHGTYLDRYVKKAGYRYTKVAG